jgi:8-oxo-dGTP pyrophosphatase MutT (NUDIX family)
VKDLHVDASQVLGAWSHDEQVQCDLRDEYLAFLDEHADAMSRTCAPGHLTASALVVDESRRNVLLTLHPKVGRWLQLGGHVEPEDVSLQAAARREAIEEGGIELLWISDVPVRLDRHAVPCRAVGMTHHWDCQYLAVVPDGSRAVISDESDDLHWFALDELPVGLDASVLALCAEVKAH